MPQCCAVPLCSNQSSGHRFPKDPALKKAWLVAIKRDKFEPTVHSRVCNKHFREDDFYLPSDSVRTNPKPLLKRGTIPSVFAWTKGPTPVALGRSERAKKRSRKHEETIQLSNETDLISENEQLPDPPSEVPSDLEGKDVYMEDDLNVECEVCVDSSEIISASNIGDSVHNENKSDSVDDCDVLIDVVSDQQCDVEGDMESGSHEPRKRESCSHAMRIADYKDKGKWEELQFYTGFESYDHFMFVFNSLGPAVNNLYYYSSYSVDGSRILKCLLPEDQFFLALMKLRRNSLNKELSYRFRISENHVSIIFVTWINFLFVQFKEIDIWVPHKASSNLMKFRGKDCDATIIIDCTEVKIVKPKNPLSQQQTYSSYKGCNTIKVLVGMTPAGAVSFISEAYGGAISDRHLFEKSGLLDKLTSNDIVLADRGFNIQDLLALKNIKVRIPDFVPTGKGQLRPSQLKRSKKVSSKRIHIERIIGLAKTFNIMKGPLPSSLVPLATRIVYVCFMLANFRPNIVM